MAPFDTNAIVTVWLPLQSVPPVDEGGSGLIFATDSHRDVALRVRQGAPTPPALPGDNRRTLTGMASCTISVEPPALIHRRTVTSLSSRLSQLSALSALA